MKNIRRMSTDSPEFKALHLEGLCQTAEAVARAKTIRDWKRAQRRAPRDAEWLRFVKSLHVER